MAPGEMGMGTGDGECLACQACCDASGEGEGPTISRPRYLGARHAGLGRAGGDDTAYVLCVQNPARSPR